MMKNWSSKLTLILVLAAIHFCGGLAFAQGLTIFGDVRITTENNAVVPRDVLLILRRVPDGEVGRQAVSSRGRYRFTNLKAGEYELQPRMTLLEIMDRLSRGDATAVWFTVPEGDALRVVACLGLHAERPGLSVLTATGTVVLA